MSTSLFIGQRVRIVRVGNPTYDHLLGTETFIADRATDRDAELGYDWLIGIRNCNGELIAACNHNLEPIQPEGLESPEEIAELFEPSPEVVHA